MNNEENNGAGTPPVEIHCNERSGKIIQEVLLADKKDPFNSITMNAVVSSANRGLPVNVTLSGSADGGRASFVSNSICTMVTMEITDKKGELMQHGAATVAKIGKDNRPIDDGPDHEGASILQLSLNNGNILPFVSALLMSVSPTLAQGCEMLNDANFRDPVEEPGPECGPVCGDKCEGSEIPDNNDPIPFPGTPVQEAEPVPAN